MQGGVHPRPAFFPVLASARTAVRSLPNYDLSAIRSVDQAVGLIESNLALLTSYISSSDFTSPQHREQLVRNIDFLAQYYVAIERILLNQEGDK